MSQSIQIINALKKCLKNNGLTYKDVANHLNISESSIKRQFTSRDISLNRLEKIGDLIGMEIVDLIDLISKENKNIEQLTIAQEKMIVSDTKLMLVTISVLNHLSFAEIHELYNFPQAELIKLLLQLESIKLIILKPNNKIKTLISRTFKWNNNGPIQRYFENNIQDDFFDCQFNQVGELRLVINGMLSATSNQIIHNKMRQLAQNFSDYAHNDQAIGIERKFGNTLVIAIRPWELPEFTKYTRANNKKVLK